MTKSSSDCPKVGNKEQAGQCVHKRNIEALPCNYFFCGKAIKYYVLQVCVCSIRYPTCNAHASYCHIWPIWLYFSTLSPKRHDFRKKILNINCVFRFSLHLFSEIFLIPRRTELDIFINVHRCYSYQILMDVEFSRCILKICSNIKFRENSSSGSRVESCARTDCLTDMTKLTDAFRPKEEDNGKERLIRLKRF
jgi:hypothetical protein